MIIKSFTADSVAAALKEVRAELGGEAVVLKTRQLVNPGDSNRIEITACLDKPTAAQASVALPDGELPSRADKAGGPASKVTSRAVRAKPAPGYVDSMELEKLSQIERKLDPGDPYFVSRDKCILLMAKNVNDISYCYEMSGEYMKEHCISVFAKRILDITLCKELSDERPHVKRSNCYLSIARELKDPKICEMIEDESMRRMCIADTTK